MSGERRKLLSFSEFTALRGKRISESRKAPQNVNDVLPVVLTFRRMEIRQWSDGAVVGLYREQRTGMEITFPR